jgi:D-alanyl-D-alanine dipeptidase
MTKFLRCFQLCLCLVAVFAATCFAIPEGFVYLDELDKTIQNSIRYFSTENFIGTRVDGYKIARIVITKQAAQALSKVQKELLKDGYSIVVYDAYRPQKAVNHFMRWSEDLNDQAMKAKYYPSIDKKNVFALGYVSKKSGHSRGSTIDLSILKIGAKLKTPTFRLRGAKALPFLDDGTIDMGSSWDFFGEASHHNSPKVAYEYTTQRNYLRTKMEKQGFRAYDQEWWHYTLNNEPFPDTYFDFDIE